ncbi:MAG: hypothetical protein A2Y56_05955 [Candidatus Aminicenantes bacterium RBG_13_63_10]|nr:MAG: hypothetical protein A2Y56_05955 [Candidatus Aminicenantes bacterium RBG_13_63_10]
MNITIGRVAALFFLMSLCLLFGQEVIDEVVAVVNGEILSRSDVKGRFELLTQGLRTQVSGEAFETQVETLRKNLIDRMITELLLLQKAKEARLDVREQVRLTIDNIKSQNNLESDEDLHVALRREGIDYNLWVRQMEEDLLRQAVLFSEVDRKIAIDDADVVKEYKAHPEMYTEPEEVALRGIFLSEEKASAEELESRKSEVSGKLAAGEDFAALAGIYSDGPAGDSGGDLGTFKKGELDLVLEGAVQKLQPGQVSGWLKSKNGWSLLRLESRKERKLKPFEDVRKEIEEKLYFDKRTKAIDVFLDSEKRKSQIKILRPNVLDY